jgi:TonB-dependent Receptor Plug Domain/Carboxypeptidase regulatory-like domain
MRIINEIGIGLAVLLGLLFGPLLTTAWAQTDQEPSSLEGTVMVRGTRELKPDATVELSGPGLDAPLETTADEKGFYRFDSVPPGQYTLTVIEDLSEPFSDTLKVRPGRQEKFNCYVQNLALEEVLVVGKKEPEAISRQEISKDELTGVPGANNDAIRVVENLPGVATTSVMGLGSDGLVIRGVSAEDSAYIFNGFEIPQLFHFGGLTSVINSELIKDITYYPGAFSVRYGDALGGVVDITGRKPRTDRFGGIVDISTYSSFVLFEGPVGKNGSAAGAVRRSYIDHVVKAVVPQDQLGSIILPRYYDFQGIFSYRLGSKHEFTVGIFGADDVLKFALGRDVDDPMENVSLEYRTYWQQGNVAWDYYANSRLSNRLAINLTNSVVDIAITEDMNYDINFLAPEFRNDLSLEIADWNELRLGVAAGGAKGEIDIDTPRDEKEGQPDDEKSAESVYHLEIDDSFWGAAAYVEDVIKPASWVQIIPGVRTEYNEYLDDFFFDPRLGVKFHPTKASTIKTSLGMYHQWPGFDEFIEDYGNPDLEPELSVLSSLGFEYDFGQGYSIDVQGYYKDLQNLVSDDEQDVWNNEGVGYVHGGELLARKKLTDRFFGWISYTYSESKRKDHPGDDWRYFDQDQTHNFIILGSYQFGREKDWRLGAKWQYFTGLPYTDIDSAVYIADMDMYEPIYSEEINGVRDDDFHKLDIRMDKLWIFKTWTLNTYLDLQNVYWQRYAEGYEYNYDYTEKEMISFPAFMPTLGLQGRF